MMARAWNRIRGNRPRDYTPLPLTEKEPAEYSKARRDGQPRWMSAGRAVQVIAGLFCVYGAIHLISSFVRGPCDDVYKGYRCSPKTTHFWGQYSMWFAVPSEINVVPPKGCEVTFANVLSRHGGRDPTLGKSIAYQLLIADIQNTSTAYPGDFAFLKDYEYNLGADKLTAAGRQEMVNSGAHFYKRYHRLVQENPPFVRAGGQERVVDSAEQWLAGVARVQGKKAQEVDVIIPEGTNWNNTLSHDTCPAFESGPSHGLGYRAMDVWASKFVPPIQERVNAALGTDLSQTSIIYLMDMCPFDTLANPKATKSDFCNLFTEKEWHVYDYLQSLGKYYGYGPGNPLAATQGVGYVNELIARLTGMPVDDHTNTNTTLDSDPTTFPLARKVYADFSHDNDMSGVLAALGLYNKTNPLSNTTIESTKETYGYSAAWTVPFAARIYVEKLQCKHDDDYVRIIVNDRVQPLEFCGGDKHGRCTLRSFIASQSFARSGGNWNQCYQ